ncbi:hypothetical protein [Vandammella animalimorsus]|uniref:hypothetical protein n=1 Tax=Vandammella animalimorsus TaxID=2029117 RepID=UPI001178597E|nr:hypothetical protein [Vandammella animalimorsus]
MEHSSPESQQLLLALCQALRQDPGLIAPGVAWHKLIVVGVQGKGHSRMYGYRFDAQGEDEAVSPDDGHAQDALRHLQQTMQAEHPAGRAWQACLIRLGSDGRFGVEFEYDNAQRWAVTPANYQQRVQEFARMPV